MKVRKKIIISLIFFGILVMLKNVSYAGTQKWNALDYNVTLNSDGSMDVIETWDIYISETNTVFKNFELDSNKYSGITNVKVKNVDTGEELTQIYKEMYHVTKNCYYALPISDGKFEIAWGVGLDNSSANKKYQISYTVEDVVKVYNDCSELYWQFLGTENTIKSNVITGTIKLPKAVNDIEKLRVWAHGPLNGEIQKENNDTVVFFIGNFDFKNMLEVRVVTEEPIFKDVLNKYSYNKLDEILEEEDIWANNANSIRKIAKNIIRVVFIIYAFLVIIVLKMIIKYKKQFNEVKMESRNKDIDIGKYFRDIPRERDSTPGQAAFLYYSNNNNFIFPSSESNIFSATLLQLCLKKMIALEKENNDIKIVFTENKKVELKEDEQIIFNLLKKASDDTDSITMQALKTYARKEYDRFSSEMNKLHKVIKNEYIRNGKYNVENEKMSNNLKKKAIIYIIITIVLVCLLNVFSIVLIPLFIGFIISAILLFKTDKYIDVLSEEGEMERQEWKGLKNYMEDFSMLNERDIPDLVLWEKYLVYATAFGISDKVIEQLKIVYPNFDNLDNNSSSYIYLMSDSHYGRDFIKDVNNSFNSVYNAYSSAYSAAHSSSSSGSGGGGGFSSGGGGRRWRWPDAVVDRMICLIKKFKVKS